MKSNDSPFNVQVLPFFITGIGTDVGKTFVSSLLRTALNGWYWKPIQAGLSPETDSSVLLNSIKKFNGVQKEGESVSARVLKESYRLLLPASPHFSAAEENIEISIEKIRQDFEQHLTLLQTLPVSSEEQEQVKNPSLLAWNHKMGFPDNTIVRWLLIEGAGGLLVPINQQEFLIDLCKALKLPIVLVSYHYLGSLNHSLLSALAVKESKLDCIGWIFNGRTEDPSAEKRDALYETQLSRWTNFNSIFSIPFFPSSKSTVSSATSPIDEHKIEKEFYEDMGEKWRKSWLEFSSRLKQPNL